MSVPDNDPNIARGASFYDVVRVEPTPAELSEVASALARFQARLACRSYLQRARIGRVWVACAVLTAAAFVGGLSLARFSFNSPVRTLSVLTREPEMIYFPPQSPAAAFADLRSGARLRGGHAFDLGANGEAERQEFALAGASMSLDAAAPAESERNIASEQTTELNLPELGRSWAEAVSVATALRWGSTPPQPDPLQHGYAAVEVSAIPEASPGLTAAAVIAAAFAWSHVAAQRKRRPRSGEQSRA